ncbi:MAG: 50S ribosomal protein L19 [bacterium]|nr:50S ribosomal protein L19 [bacterium]
MTANKTNTIKFSPVDVEARKKLDFRAGDTVRVWSKIAEEKAGKKKGEKSTIKFRLQAFEGIVLARKHGREFGATFTVRRIASGVGVERIFPLFSPMVDKVEITKKANAGRSKLYYVRTKAVKDVRRKLRSVTKGETVAMGEMEEDTDTEAETSKE